MGEMEPVNFLVNKIFLTRFKVFVKVKAIYISPGHNFYGHYGKSPSNHPLLAVDSVDCVAGKGLVGDRFFNYKPNYKGQVTLFDYSVYQAMCDVLGIYDKDPMVLRRNLLVEGQDLLSFVGKKFVVQGVDLFGVEECSPCFWMDQAFGVGAENFLKDQGGLRCRILTDGVFSVNQ